MIHDCADVCVISFMEAGLLCNIEYLFETHLKLKSREISLVHNMSQLSNRFEILCRAWHWYCHVLGKTSRRLEYWHMLWMKEILCDLSLRGLSERYYLLHSIPGVHFNRKISSYWHRIPHCKVQAAPYCLISVIRIPVVGKTVFMLKQEPEGLQPQVQLLDLIPRMQMCHTSANNKKQTMENTMWQTWIICMNNIKQPPQPSCCWSSNISEQQIDSLNRTEPLLLNWNKQLWIAISLVNSWMALDDNASRNIGMPCHCCHGSRLHGRGISYVSTKDEMHEDTNRYMKKSMHCN